MAPAGTQTGLQASNGAVMCPLHGSLRAGDTASCTTCDRQENQMQPFRAVVPFQIMSSWADLVLHKGCEGQVVEQIGEELPDIGVAVLSETLVVEAVPAGYKDRG